MELLVYCSSHCGTAIYSATAGKDNKTASSNEKGWSLVGQPFAWFDLQRDSRWFGWRRLWQGQSGHWFPQCAEGDQNKVATMKQLVDKDNQVLIGIATVCSHWLVQPKTNQSSWSYHRSGRRKLLVSIWNQVATLLGYLTNNQLSNSWQIDRYWPECENNRCPILNQWG